MNYIPDASYAAAYFYFALGIVVTLAVAFFFSQWMKWNGIISFFDSRQERDAAERRIRDLKPLSDPADDWTPARWPTRRNVR